MNPANTPMKSPWLLPLLSLLLLMGTTGCPSDGDDDTTADDDDVTDDDVADDDADDDDDMADDDDTGEPPVEVEDYEQTCVDRDHDRCFYVSNTGSYPGGTEGHQLVLDEVSSSLFQPGDIILFARSDVWRAETDDALITLTSSGASDNPIVHGAYGDGDRPTFLGSIQAAGWSHVSGNVWEASTDIPSDPDAMGYGAQLFFELADGSALFGHHESSTGGLDREGDWSWSGGRVSVYATADPATLYTSVEAPQAQRLIRLDDQQHVAFDSMILRYMVSAGFYDSYGNALGLEGLRVTNSEIAYIGHKNSGSAYGLSLERSDVTIAGNTIHDCGRRSVSLVLYETPASVIRDVVIEHNHFYNGYHTTGVDVQSNAASSGGHLIENLVIRNNLFEGDPAFDIGGEDGSASNHIWMNQDEGSQLRDIYIYNNLFTYAHGSSIKTSGGQDVFIHHNTFFGFNHSYDNYQAHVFCGDRTANVTIANNICYNDATDSRYACIEFGDGRHDEFQVDFNLYHAANYEHTRILWVDGGTSWFVDDDWNDYVTQTGFDASSPEPADPEFVAAPDDLRPSATSPAVGAGADVAWITTDFHGDDRTSPPDIGAIQHTE